MRTILKPLYFSVLAVAPWQLWQAPEAAADCDGISCSAWAKACESACTGHQGVGSIGCGSEFYLCQCGDGTGPATWPCS